MAGEPRKGGRRSWLLALLGGATLAVLGAGVVAAVVHDGEKEPSQGAAQTWECLMSRSGFSSGMPVGMAAYLLEHRLTRGGYTERGQAFYEGVLDDLRERDPREPLGPGSFGDGCDALEDGDLDPLASSFDDDVAAEAIVRRADGRFEEAKLGDLVDRLSLDPDHGQPVYARFDGTDAMVVFDAGAGTRSARAFSDADGDGRFVEVDSGGLRVPAHTSEDGSAVAGVAFFSSAGFAFGYTSEPGAVSASLSTEGLHLPLIEVHDGVADLTDAWTVGWECDRPFRITWTGPGGAVVDELTGTFHCAVH